MNDQERIHQKLDKIDDGVNELLQWKSALDERCNAHLKRTDELSKTVYKNPGGLEIEVRRLMNCKENIQRWRNFWLFILRSFLSAAIIGTVIFLLKIYKAI